MMFFIDSGQTVSSAQFNFGQLSSVAITTNRTEPKGTQQSNSRMEGFGFFCLLVKSKFLLYLNHHSLYNQGKCRERGKHCLLARYKLNSLLDHFCILYVVWNIGIHIYAN